MYKKLKIFLEKYLTLKNHEWLFIKNIAKIRKYKKGEIIHQSGTVCKYLCFINTGLARGYVINSKGLEYTWHIFFNDSRAKINNLLVVDYDSFLNSIESKITIEALKDSELLCFSKESIDLLLKTKAGMLLGLKLTQESYSILHNYIISYATQSAEERFETFMKHSSCWFDFVPQYYIATHLGITPQSLSRLKNNKTKKVSK